jgi:photosystem II stability/assembly factor-like uncharacterized protein
MGDNRSADFLEVGASVEVLDGRRWLPGTVLMTHTFHDGSTWAMVRWSDEATGFHTDIWPQHLCRPRSP